MNKPSLLTSWAFVVVLGSAWYLDAEEARQVAIGDRVRLTMPTKAAQPLVGTIVGLSGDTLDLKLKDQATPVPISRSAIARLDVSGGRKRGRGAAMGALLGLTAGALAAALVTSQGNGEDESLAYLLFGGGGLVLGTGIGAAVGWGERWTEVPARNRASTASPGRTARHAGFRISVRF